MFFKNPIAGALFVFFLLFFFTSKWVSAHQDDYLSETLVYKTQPKYELEPEYTFDFHKAKGESNDFFLNTLAFVYGITTHWMMDGSTTLKTTTSGDNSFHSSKIETKYRFLNENELPVNIAVNMEYEFENGDEKEHFINPRLVFSKDITPNINTTLNFFGEIQVADALKARGGYALAMRYPEKKAIRFGIEVQGLHPNPNEIRIVPQIWCEFPYEIILKAGSGINLIGKEERFFARAELEIEL